MNRVTAPSIKLLRNLDTNIFSLFPQISGLFEKQKVKPLNSICMYTLQLSVHQDFQHQNTYRDIFL